MSLKNKIKSGHFVIIEEFEPPKGADFSSFRKNATLVKGRVNAFVVPEMANAVMKAGSLGGCAYLQREGLETVCQVCSRDRNRLALQADILSAGALGIENIMAVQGEDIHFGDHPKARAVNDLDSLELLETIKALQKGKDLAGIELTGAPDFFMGSNIDTNAPGGLLELELENLRIKIDTGVEFIVTNPIFDIHGFRQFIRRIKDIDIAIIPTVLLLKSAGMARYIDRNMKNISIPSEMIRDIQKAPDKQKQCISIAAELIGQLREMGMSGVMISTAGWEDKVPRILDEAGL
ncbi:MAG: methylenetetrahydrofolate reductase [Deltaproteobacteria bacterium]|nr:methylenetetrahydrofolate reductase [Deltaproteobacteria bacterium]